MIKLEFPKANLNAYESVEDKVKALKGQVDTLSANLQIILDSIDESIDEETIRELVAPDLDSMSKSVKEISDRVTDIEDADYGTRVDGLENLLTVKRATYENTSIKKGSFYIKRFGALIWFCSNGDFVNLPTGSTTYLTLPNEFKPWTNIVVYPANSLADRRMMFSTNGNVIFYNGGAAITSATNGYYTGVYWAQDID